MRDGADNCDSLTPHMETVAPLAVSSRRLEPGTVAVSDRLKAGWVYLPRHFENSLAVDRLRVLFVSEQPDVPNDR